MAEKNIPVDEMETKELDLDDLEQVTGRLRLCRCAQSSSA